MNEEQKQKEELMAYSDKELRAELQRREEEIRKKTKPKTLTGIDWEELIDICEKYIDDLDKQGWVDDDMYHYIFETAIETVYGKPIWAWIREKKK